MSLVSVIIPMYNAGEKIEATLDSVCAQSLPENWYLEIVVVDDASRDQSMNIVRRFPDERVRLIKRRENGGRAKACNEGLQAATGEYCLFLDADCTYTNNHTIRGFITLFNRGVKVCFGAVTTEGEGFWYRYQRENYARRRLRDHNHDLITTANFGVKRRLLLQIGGFNDQYQHYGFEDRDLIYTLRKHLLPDDIAVTYQLRVNHRDPITLKQVCHKMFEAGRYSSLILRRRHPHEYQKMSYARFDLNLMPPGIVPFCCLMLRKRLRLICLGDKLIRSRICPRRFKYLYVKILSALFYMAGTGSCP